MEDFVGSLLVYLIAGTVVCVAGIKLLLSSRRRVMHWLGSVLMTAGAFFAIIVMMLLTALYQPFSS